MKTNSQLQKEVQNAIHWEPLLHATKIGVNVENGIVTLDGTVNDYSKKIKIEAVVKSIAGVKAVLEGIEVKFANANKKSDADITAGILHSLQLNMIIPAEKIQVKVKNGCITLEGQLPWNYQREVVLRVVNHAPGVKMVFNNLKIRSELKDSLEQKDIEAALARNWMLDNHDIKVKIFSRTVTLLGKVTSWYQKDKAESITWNTPGIWHVDNQLEVEYNYSLID